MLMGYSVLKVPTGVPDFDAIIKGGLPEGSVVLLTGDIGAGQQEFIYTSAYKKNHFCWRATLAQFASSKESPNTFAMSHFPGPDWTF
jgi:KaiC/GvpD/RAD55 family RecA-like ATPase